MCFYRCVSYKILQTVQFNISKKCFPAQVELFIHSALVTAVPCSGLLWSLPREHRAQCRNAHRMKQTCTHSSISMYSLQLHIITYFRWKKTGESRGNPGSNPISEVTCKFQVPSLSVTLSIVFTKHVLG